MAWLVWLASCGVVVVLAVDVPGGVKLSLCLLLLSALRTLHRFVLLRGPRAVRALEWSPGQFHLWLGEESPRRLPAVPVRCRRYGVCLWLLHFATSEGGRGLLVDTHLQDPVSLRRLSRGLDWASGGGIAVPGGQ